MDTVKISALFQVAITFIESNNVEITLKPIVIIHINIPHEIRRKINA